MNGKWDLSVARPTHLSAMASLGDLVTSPGVVPIRSVWPTGYTVGSPAGIIFTVIVQSSPRALLAHAWLSADRSGRAQSRIRSVIETRVTHSGE